MSNITPQGYTYGEDPKSTHPFWEENGGDDTPTEVVQVSASATVDDTTGTPSVTVTQSGDNNQNIAFAFSGIKGEQGETGATGPQGTSPTVASTGNTGSGEIAGTVTSGGDVITIYNGAQGEQGPQGETGAAGSDADVNGTLTNVSITSENHIYTISQTKKDNTVEAGETTTEVGTIEVPEQERGIVEVKDTVTENADIGYDLHTLTETEDDGTENEVGKFYLAQKQFTGNISSSFGLNMGFAPVINIGGVDQSGKYNNQLIAENKYIFNNYLHLSSSFTDIVFPDNLTGIMIYVGYVKYIGGLTSKYFYQPISSAQISALGKTVTDSNGVSHTFSRINIYNPFLYISPSNEDNCIFGGSITITADTLSITIFVNGSGYSVTRLASIHYAFV